MMLIGSGVSILVVAGLLVLNAFRSNIVFFSSPSDIFWSPSEVVTGKAPAQQVIRMGGRIEGAPVSRGASPKLELEFTLSDKVSKLPVSYRGPLNEPLAANQAVIVRGRLEADGRFLAEALVPATDKQMNDKAPVLNRFRVGGLVEAGSIKKIPNSLKVSFSVTDLAERITVHYEGILPDLFRDGQGTIAEGRLQADGSFLATTVLAKHDEKYMPPEVASTLKQATIVEPKKTP
jgi:cytochrome c-type biogenesis protein CcmE